MVINTNTFRLDDKVPKIFAIGDIHGDIIPFIVALRDCCRVIKKKSDYRFNQKEKDQDMIKELSKEWSDNSYIEDLNYEWVGNDAYVVLCGDIINNSRSQKPKPEEYPLEELRILKFINAINKMAMKKGGRIFKVIGNHDFDNINKEILTSPYKNNLVTKKTGEYEGYKVGAIDRFHYFNNGNIGAQVFGIDNAYLFLVIRDFIFVHGGISSGLFNFENLNYINEKFNSYLNDASNTLFDKESNSLEYKLVSSDGGPRENGLVKCRYFSQRFDKISEEEICGDLEIKFNILLEGLRANGYSGHKNFRLVVGHSTQNKFFNEKNTYYSTYDNLIKENYINDGIIVNNKFVEGNVYNGDGKIKDDIIINNGISVGCNNERGLSKIFRIDVGLSRGAFNFKDNDTDEYLYSRTPQVLEIIYEDNIPKVNIIKSSVENTKIHISDLGISNETYGIINGLEGGYYYKYLKYKAKYANLKKKFN
jgi:hypothetical protein